MRWLLDTYVFLCWIAGTRKLRPSVASTLDRQQNEIYVSAVSVWEIAVKHVLGKLALPATHRDSLALVVANAGFVELPVTAAHSALTLELPLLHRDPFDRLLLAQAKLEGLALVTVDAELSRYGVPLVSPV